MPLRPDFEKGNELGLVHGARSTRRWLPTAEALAKGLVDVAPWTERPAFAATVASWSKAEAQCQLLHAYLDDVGLLDDNGEPRPALNTLNTTETRANNLRQRRPHAGRPGEAAPGARRRSCIDRRHHVTRRRACRRSPDCRSAVGTDPVIPALLLGLVHEDGRRWGEVASAWNGRRRSILDPNAARRLHFLTRPRGASKTTDLAAIVLTAMLEQLPPGAQCYGVAADRDQAQLLLRELAGFVNRSGLSYYVQVDTYKATTTTGVTLTALPADEASAYGLRPHFVVVDELAQWGTSGRPSRFYDVMFSAIPKVAASRFVVITTAGDPAHWSRRILDHALRSKSWRVNEVPGPTPWLDPQTLEEPAPLPVAVDLRPAPPEPVGGLRGPTHHAGGPPTLHRPHRPAGVRPGQPLRHGARHWVEERPDRPECLPLTDTDRRPADPHGRSGPAGGVVRDPASAGRPGRRGGHHPPRPQVLQPPDSRRGPVPGCAVDLEPAAVGHQGRGVQLQPGKHRAAGPAHVAALVAARPGAARRP